jgi:hypothetical protein
MITRLFIFVWLTGILCFIAVGILDCQMRERAKAQPAGGVMSDAEKARFMPILKKHGLQYDVTVIHDWPGPNAYYIDKQGRRIKFK